MDNPVLEGLAAGLQMRQAMENAALRKRQFEAQEEQRRLNNENEAARIVQGLLGIGARPADYMDRAEAQTGMRLPSIEELTRGQGPQASDIKGRIRKVAGDEWVMPTREEMQRIGLEQRLAQEGQLLELKNRKKLEGQRLLLDQLGVTLTPDAYSQYGISGQPRLPLDAVRSLGQTMSSFRRSEVMENRPGPAQRIPSITLLGDAAGQYAIRVDPKTGEIVKDQVAGPKPLGGRSGTGTTPEERAAAAERKRREGIQSLIDKQQAIEDGLWSDVRKGEEILASGRATPDQTAFYNADIAAKRTRIRQLHGTKAALIERKDGAEAGARARRQLGLETDTPADPAARQGATASKPTTAAPAAKSATKTITRQWVLDKAKEKGKTPAEIERLMNLQGWTIK